MINKTSVIFDPVEMPLTWKEFISQVTKQPVEWERFEINTSATFGHVRIDFLSMEVHRSRFTSLTTRGSFRPGAATPAETRFFSARRASSRRGKCDWTLDRVIRSRSPLQGREFAVPPLTVSSVPLSGFSAELRQAADAERFWFSYPLRGDVALPVHVVFSRSAARAEVKAADLSAL